MKKTTNLGSVKRGGGGGFIGLWWLEGFPTAHANLGELATWKEIVVVAVVVVVVGGGGGGGWN